MLNLVARQQPVTILSYFEPVVISVKNGIAPIQVYDKTDLYIEPFVYIDGGLYDAVGTPVDAEYYNTTSWTTTWNAKYP